MGALGPLNQTDATAVKVLFGPQFLKLVNAPQPIEIKVIDGQHAPPALADVFVDQDKRWTRDVIGHVQGLAHALDHAGLTAAQVAAPGDYIARDQVPTERNTQRVGLRRRMRGENLFHFPHLGSIIATGKIISSSDRPPCWKLPL